MTASPITAIFVGSKVMGLKIRVPMQALMECVIAKTISRGLRSHAGTYCPQPDEAPHVVGKVGEPDLHAGCARPIVRIVRLSRPF